MGVGGDITPGTLRVELVEDPVAGPGEGGAVLLEVTGPQAITAARVPSRLRLFMDTFGATATQFIVTGPLDVGTLLEVDIRDVREAASYRVRVLQIAGAGYQLLNAGWPWVAIAR